MFLQCSGVHAYKEQLCINTHITFFGGNTCDSPISMSKTAPIQSATQSSIIIEPDGCSSVALSPVTT